jgi:aspartate/methionine/tyrosine aminotransferase
VTLRPAERVRNLRRTLIREIFESAPPDALNLGLGQPDLDPPDVLREALAEAALGGPAGYGPTQGDPELRALVAATYAPLARGPEDVMVTAGCQQATFVTLGALLDPADEVLVPDPGFPGAARAASAWGARPVGYPLRPERTFHLDPDEVAAACGPVTRALLVISPSNPTGTIEPAASLARLGDLAAERDLALLLDDTYRDFHWLDDGPAPGPPPGAMERTIVCGGLSKSGALTGWRLGWIVCRDRELMARMVALQQTVLTCAATPVQRAARTAFTERGRAGMRALRQRFRDRRDLVERVLGGAGLRLAPLEGAFYAFVDVGAAGGGTAFARRLLDEEKIVVIPGEAFGEVAADWVRVSYAQEETRLLAALETIARMNRQP